MDYENVNAAITTAVAKEKPNDLDVPQLSPGLIVGASKAREDLERQKAIEGDAHFHRLGWKRLAIVCIVQSIALGSLGLPSAFAKLSMVFGVFLCVTIGIAATYASYTLGQVILKFRHVRHYVDIGTLMLGKPGTVLISFFFVSLGILAVGSHCLTGKIALATISQSGICSILFSAITASILLVLAIPPSFTEIAILGYVDFVSIIIAIGITIVATGIQSQKFTGSNWSAWPKPGLTFTESIVAINNIVFAFGYASSQPSFMAEMHTPEHYLKSIYTLSAVEIVVYTLTGALIYAFVGQDVKSPALLSAGPTISRIAFGVALPVIFISGSILTTATCRYMHGEYYRDSIVKYINTKKGWTTWLGLITVFTLISWAIAEAIPFFSELLSIAACLFVSGLSFYWPVYMWFSLLKDGTWYERKNSWPSIFNGLLFVFGMVVFITGTYASVTGLINNFKDGSLSKPFAC